MSEIRTIYDNTFTIGQTSATNFVGGPGISITQPSEGTVRISNDETVLYDANGASTTSAHLSESITAFEYTKFYMHDDGGTCWGCGELLSRDASGGFNTIQCGFTTHWNTTGMRTIVAKNTDSSLQNWVTDGYQWWGTGGGAISTGYMIIQKVIGINRISGGNA